MRAHLASLDGIELKEAPPAKDWNEKLERAKTGFLGFAQR